MANIPQDVLNSAMEETLGDVRRWMKSATCQLEAAEVVPTLLSGIYLKLTELAKTSSFGNNYYDIRPVTILPDQPVLLVDKQNQGLVRKVVLWIDNASGGPTPTIRVSKGATNYTSGGVRVNAGQSNELGEIPPNVQLWGSSSYAINAYVIEWA